MIGIFVRVSTRLLLARGHELLPVSRTRFGSPCRFVRVVDLLVHVVLPEVIGGRLPGAADYLRSTSPRWGRTWRHW